MTLAESRQNYLDSQNKLALLIEQRAQPHIINLQKGFIRAELEYIHRLETEEVVILSDVKQLLLTER